MDSVIAGALDGLGLPTGLARLVELAGASTPYVPSAPVEIGTSKHSHGVTEVGSWQTLLVMFGVVLVLGASVLMYAVRQRTRLLERRRVRRMGQVAKLVAAAADDAADEAAAAEAAGQVDAARTEPSALAIPLATLTPPTPQRTAPGTPGRPAPSA